MVVSSLRRLRKTLDDDLLLTVTFRSVEDYLQRLEDCCKSMSSPYEERGSMKLCVVYLAAAVSDFYIPKEERCLHKIQSRSTVGSTGSPGLSLELKPVPKLLRKVVDEWCRESFVISFKLEVSLMLFWRSSHNELFLVLWLTSFINLFVNSVDWWKYLILKKSRSYKHIWCPFSGCEWVALKK